MRCGYELNVFNKKVPLCKICQWNSLPIITVFLVVHAVTESLVQLSTKCLNKRLLLLGLSS